MAIVYRHRRLDTNEIFYIGIGKKEYRAINVHNRNKWWNNIVSKVGFQAEIIAKDLDWEDAKELEILLIELYGRKDLGLGNLINLTNGGDGKLGGKGSLGTKLTDEHKKAISDFNKGKILTKEHKENLSKSRQGLKLSTEIKEQLKEKRKKLPATNAKIVLNTETGIFYDNAKEAAKISNINYTTFVYYLNHKDKNKTSFIYI